MKVKLVQMISKTISRRLNVGRPQPKEAVARLLFRKLPKERERERSRPLGKLSGLGVHLRLRRRTQEMIVILRFELNFNFCRGQTGFDNGCIASLLALNKYQVAHCPQCDRILVNTHARILVCGELPAIHPLSLALSSPIQADLARTFEVTIKKETVA